MPNNRMNNYAESSTSARPSEASQYVFDSSNAAAEAALLQKTLGMAEQTGQINVAHSPEAAAAEAAAASAYQQHMAVAPQYVHDAANASAEASLASHSREVPEQLRPVNTQHAYHPKQLEFQRWCVATHYPHSFVTELKLMRFIEHIKARGIITRKKNADGTVTTTRRNYSYESLKQYIKACVDLHNKQKAANRSNGIQLPHPRGESLKIYEQNLKKECVNSKKDECEDPGVGSIQDGYNTDQLVLIANYYWQIKKDANSALRDRMVFLMNHMMMLRGETLRTIPINHLFSIEFKDEGAQYCPALVMMSTEGKANQENHKEYRGVIRHKDVLTCAFGAAAFYFFFRFQVADEPFPDMNSNQGWFDIMLVKGRLPEKSVSYQTQLNSIHKAFASIGIRSKKKAHSGRQAGAGDAEMAGLSNDHIRQVGRWNDDSLQNSYLDCLPRTAIRVMQGFPEERGCFWLPRNLVTPPLSLQRKVFPQVEEWQQKMNANEIPQTICGEGFLALLVEMRPILLQDAVIIRRVFPDHKVFQHEIFRSEEFNAFAEHLELEMETATPPAELEIQRVVPLINQRLDELTHQVNAASNRNITSVAVAIERLQQSLESLSAKVDRITVKVDRITVESDSHLASGSRVRRREEREDEEVEKGNEVALQDDDEHQEKRYRMSRYNTTVTSLWKEWTVGLSASLPSIEYMDEHHKKTWRRETKERKFYSTRLVIIKEIRRIFENSLTTEEEESTLSPEEAAQKLKEAAQKLENERKTIYKGCSLDKLSRQLTARNKQQSAQPVELAESTESI